jgi:hypothetical protein
VWEWETVGAGALHAAEEAVLGRVEEAWTAAEVVRVLATVPVEWQTARVYTRALRRLRELTQSRGGGVEGGAWDAGADRTARALAGTGSPPLRAAAVSALPNEAPGPLVERLYATMRRS